MNRCVCVARIPRLAIAYSTGKVLQAIDKCPTSERFTRKRATIHSLLRNTTMSNESSNPLDPANIPRADSEAGDVPLPRKHLMLPRPASNATVARAKLVPPQALFESRFPSTSLSPRTQRKKKGYSGPANHGGHKNGEVGISAPMKGLDERSRS